MNKFKKNDNVIVARVAENETVDWIWDEGEDNPIGELGIVVEVSEDDDTVLVRLDCVSYWFCTDVIELIS